MTELMDLMEAGQATRMLGTNWDITESKQREADLARTTQRLLDNDLAMDSVGIGVSWVDEETGRFTYANRTMLQRLGYTAEEFTHLHVWDINPSFSSAQFRSSAETLQTSGSFKKNTLHRTKDGRDIPVEIIVYTRPPHDGLPSMRIVFQTDITERHASELALESSEKQMRFVLEGAELGYWDWNIPAGTVDRNARWAEMLGYEHAEIQHTARQWSDFIHPEDRSRAWESINAVLEGRSDSHRLEYRMLHKDGSVRWILDQAKVMQRDPDGKPLRMCGTHTDITSRKQSEATLIENEARYRHLIESLPDVAYSYSVSQGGIYYSPRATEVLGYPLDELLAQPQIWSDAIHPEDRPRVQGAVSRLLTQQEPFKLEYRIRDAKGNWHWLYDRSIGVRHVSNDALIDGLAMDITQTRKVQDELDQHRHHLEKLIEERTHELTLAKDAAEAAAKAKSEFLANMSHEIRTPLNGVLGLAQIGYRDSAGREKTKETFSQILDSGKLLLTIINDILDFSKIEAGKLPIESIPIAPGLLADEAIRNVTTLADRKHFKLSVEKIDLPAGCLGDPVRISQILLNLLANAIKFTEHGEVSLCARREGQQLVFAVRDTGIGILPETLVRLFQPFEQADSSVTRKFGGTGLGLVISRRLAELMGGSLTAESTPGQGSTFILHLPLKEAERPIVSGTVAVRGAKRLAGLNLLVAEDNAVNQIVIEDMLRGEGAEVTLVSTGQEALDTIEQASTPFDAVLMDVQMPELDGLEATRQLKQSHPDLQVIGQTAHALKEELDKCHAAGMVSTINKPIDLEIMVSTLLDLIHKPVQRLKVSEATTLLDEKGAVDWVALEQRFPNRAELVERLTKMTLEGHAEDGNRLRTLATSGDLNEIQRLAHDWKSLAGNLCASDAESLAIRTMTGAKAGDNEALQLAQELASAVDRLIAALRQGRPG